MFDCMNVCCRWRLHNLAHMLRAFLMSNLVVHAVNIKLPMISPYGNDLQCDSSSLVVGLSFFDSLIWVSIGLLFGAPGNT